MSGESKKTAEEGRLASPTPAAAGADLLGEVARGVGQRGAGKRSQEFVAKIANAYGMLPGDLLAATLMKGLRRHVDQGGDPGDFLEARAIDLANSMQTSTSHAMSMLLSVAHELMPYVHQKQPMAVELDQRSITFVVQAQAGQAQGGGPGGLDLRPADVRETPMKSVDAPARSDGAGRMDAPNTLKKQED
jgi:hypothetical protein